MRFCCQYLSFFSWLLLDVCWHCFVSPFCTIERTSRAVKNILFLCLKQNHVVCRLANKTKRKNYLNKLLVEWYVYAKAKRLRSPHRKHPKHFENLLTQHVSNVNFTLNYALDIFWTSAMITKMKNHSDYIGKCVSQ